MATLCAPQEHFVDRVYKYPVVTDTCGKISDYYSWAKSKSPVVKKGLEYAEYTVQTAYSTAQPVIRSFDGQITLLDKFSCRQLDKLERSYPIISKPTDQVVEKTKVFYETGVKPRVSGLVLPVLKPISTTCSTITDGVSTVTRYGLATVSTFSNTRPGRVALSRLNDALDLADHFLDRHLPPDGQSESTSKCSPQTAVRPAVVARRVACLTAKARRRMYYRAMKDLKHLKCRSDETIKRMTKSVDLIAYARVHLDATKDYSDQLTSEWRTAMFELEGDEEPANLEGDNFQIEIDEAEANPEPIIRTDPQDRILTSARFWAHRLRLATTAAGLVCYRHLPDNLRLKLDEASFVANSLYNQLHSHNRIQELQLSFAESARKAICTISDHMNAAFDYLATTPLLNWLPAKSVSEEIEMKPLSMCHDSKACDELPDSGESECETKMT